MTLPDLGNSYLLEGMAQAEFCVNRNSWSTKYEYVYTWESNWPQNVISLSSPSSTLLPPLSHCTFTHAVQNLTRLKNAV